MRPVPMMPIFERLLSRRDPRVDERHGTEDEAGSEQQRATRESVSERSCTHGTPAMS